MKMFTQLRYDQSLFVHGYTGAQAKECPETVFRRHFSKMAKIVRICSQEPLCQICTMAAAVPDRSKCSERLIFKAEIITKRKQIMTKIITNKIYDENNAKQLDLQPKWNC